MKKRLFYSFVILTILLLTACNLPAAEATATPLSIDAAFTAAAQTVEARLTIAAETQAASGPLATDTLPPTATSELPTATNTPLAQPSNTPQQTCDIAEFVSDVTVADGTNFFPGDKFTKTWRIKNVGTCSWTSSYTLFFSSGNSLNGPSSIPLSGNVNPGQSVDISIDLTAPDTAGDYTGYWKLRNASGLAFTTMYTKITVGNGGGGIFAVTRVTFSSTGGCDGFSTTATITTNGAGSVSYHWVRSDGATDTEPHADLVYDAAGNKSVSKDWDTTADGDHWIEIYIDEPNHQQFGRAEFSCP